MCDKSSFHDITRVKIRLLFNICTKNILKSYFVCQLNESLKKYAISHI